MASHKALRKKVTKYIEEAKESLLMQAWTIRLEWDLENEVNEKGMVRLLHFQGSPEYMSGVIKVNLEYLAQCTDKAIRLHCGHEMVHAFVLRYTKVANSRCVTADQLRDEEETLVQTLAKILFE